ncbi:hypothetical protein R0J91_15835, partial [Micrococcus sp. SIMBA_131]
MVLDIEVDLNHLYIHEKLYECFDAEYSRSDILATYGILEQIYPERGESEMSHYLDGAYGRLVSTTTDIKKLGEDRSRVRT